MSGQLRYGAKLTDKFVAKALDGIRPHLLPSEELRLLVKVTKLRPLFDGVLVTNMRVLAFNAPDVAAKGPRVALGAGEIIGAEIKKRFTGSEVIVRTLAGEIELGTTALHVVPDDGELLVSEIRRLTGLADTGTSAAGTPAPGANHDGWRFNQDGPWRRLGGAHRRDGIRTSRGRPRPTGGSSGSQRRTLPIRLFPLSTQLKQFR
jgi:hypothetical protein